jgi:FixJ family two-component response regulator
MSKSGVLSSKGRKHNAVASLIGVVDDDESVRDAISSLIRSAGYECILYPSAEAFLDSERLSDTDCMVLDVRMQGMSGFDLQVRLREMDCLMPIIFVTAHSDEDLRARAINGGAAALLAKPFKDDALLDTIRSVLDSGVRSRDY